MDAKGEVAFCRTVITDISEQKKKESELRQERDKAQKYLNVAEVMFVVLDAKGLVTLINQKGCKLLDLEEKDILGKNWFDNFLPEYIRQEAKNVFDKLMIGRIQSVEYFENPVLTGAGQERRIAWRNTVLKDQNNKIVGTLSSGEDITERKEAEQKLQKYQEQLEPLALELSLAEERERRRIAAGIHNDIAQRLAIAKLKLKSIQNMVSDQNVLTSLESQYEMMDKIMQDARSLTFELSNFLLYEIGIEAAIESFLTRQIQERSGIKCTFTSQGPQIDLDEEISIVLYQGVREVLTNIIKHAHANHIDVRVIKNNRQISIIVQDDGIGFDVSRLSLSEKEQRGFCLFNIREGLEYLDGTVTIQSAPTKGTCVTMSIPIKLKTVNQDKERLP